MRVTIRADATQAIGAGHVMRCFALAEELTDRGATVDWHGRFEVEWVSQLIASGGWPVYRLNEHGTSPPLPVDSDVVIVDSYSSTWEYQQSLRDRGVAVVSIIDDFHKGFGPADLWVNPGVGLEWDPPSTGRFLNGPEYVLIRSQVRSLREIRASRPTSGASRRTVVALLGGTDFSGLSDLMMAMAAELAESCDLVVGPSQRPPETTVRWAQPGQDLMTSAALADLVVSPAGVSSWELLFVGTPLALIQMADNQCGNYEWMVNTGLAHGLGKGMEFLRGELLGARVKEALVRAQGLEGAGQRTVDGLGPARVSDAIIALMSPDPSGR